MVNKIKFTGGDNLEGIQKLSHDAIKKNRLLNGNIFKLLIIQIIIFSLTAYAENFPSQKKVYPPYPEVWGYDLVDNPMIPEGYANPIPYLAPNGDIVFGFKKCKENCDKELYKHKYDYAMLWFFGNKIEICSNNVDYMKNNNLTFYDYKNVLFSDGTQLNIYNHPKGNFCQNNLIYETVILKGKPKPEEPILSFFDKEIEKYTILSASPKIERFLDKEDGKCDRGGPGGGELKYLQLEPFINFIGLKDDSFLTYSDNLIIRFNKDFNTDFKPQHDIKLTSGQTIKGNFFVLPYSKIEELNQKVMKNNDHGTQGLHDELLLYLFRRQENKN